MFQKITTNQRRAIGWVTLSAAGFIAFAWFFWLAPLRHLNSWEWVRGHSMQDYWNECQKQIHRTGADHDSSISVGCYGDKAWAEWLIQKLYSSDLELDGSCGDWPYHLDSALVGITNQRMTNAAGWRAWWEKNKDKTQVEWIREGFTQRGLILQQPLTTTNIIDLLKLACASTNFFLPTNGVSREFLFRRPDNAFRWLRDSGFRARDFDLAVIPENEKVPAIRALLLYAQWFGEHCNDPGKLAISSPISESSPWREPFYSEAYFKWIVYGVLAALIGSGYRLIRQSRRKLQ